MGMADKPGVSHSVRSRCLCVKCGKSPQIEVNGSDYLTITAKCHGQTETRGVDRKEMVYTQRFFDNKEDDIQE